MSQLAIPAIPENAPFNARQRAWLNGFLAGLISSGRSAQPAALSEHAISVPSRVESPSSWKDVQSDDPAQYAWHRTDLSLDDRLNLSQDKALEFKYMAAMAQLNCGQCGYLCRTYSKALETGEETDFKKCVPGGKATVKALLRLKNESAKNASSELPTQTDGKNSTHGANGTSLTKTSPGLTLKAPTSTGSSPSAPALVASSAYGRQNPFPADALHVEKLTGQGSNKDVRLVSLSISGSGLQYQVGDALGVFPKNAKAQVEALLKLLDLDGCQPVRTADGTSATLRRALAELCDIKTASDELLELMLSRATDKADEKDLQRCLNQEEVEGLAEEPRLIDVIARFRNIRLTGEELVRKLDPLRPRLYSIASSPLVNSNQVDLIVGVVQYVVRGQQRQGVASTFLANRMMGYEAVPVFVQPCHHFGLPADPTTPIVMVGPGTGIAPFRAFLHQRRASGATGANWLFFGDQHEATDFLLRDELLQMKQDGLLTELSTAFSRDQEQRIYVQHRMLERAEELWKWLQRGAHFYVCGDASKMAGDVDRALHQIALQTGGMTSEAAERYVRELTKSGRYQRDVY